MKNILCLLLLIFSSALFVKPNTNILSKIHVDIKTGETLINFISNNEIEALYIQDNGINSLVLLDYKTDKNTIENNLKNIGINSIHKIHTVTPVIITLFDVKGEQLNTENNLLKLNYYNRVFCVYLEEYQENPNLKLCDYIYMFDFKEEVLTNLKGNPKVIFQNEKNPLPIKFQEQIYDDWTELYTINNTEYTMLKITQNSYETLIIPKEKAE